jgi:hypothetical protein
MEPRGCNPWQSVAKRIRAKPTKTSQNHCRVLRSVAESDAKGTPSIVGFGKASIRYLTLVSNRSFR